MECPLCSGSLRNTVKVFGQAGVDSCDQGAALVARQRSSVGLGDAAVSSDGSACDGRRGSGERTAHDEFDRDENVGHAGVCK